MQILKKTKSHYSTLGRKGNDEFDVAIPRGYQFDSAELKILEKHSGGGARFVKKPGKGQTGQGKIKVHWWYDAFGKIRYQVIANAVPIPVGAVSQPETKIIDSATKSHYSLIGKKGDDTVQVSLPNGFSFRRVELIFLDGDGARIEEQPPVGSSGKLAFRVHWWYDALGKVRYRLRVTAQKDAEYQMTCTGVTWTPNPAKAGNVVEFSASLTNNGSKTISDIRVVGEAYAKSMEDVPGVVLDTLTSNQRTQKVYDETETIDLAPGGQTTLTIDVPIDKTISAQGHTVSTAGEYRITLTAYLTSGPSLCSYVIQSFKVTK